MTRIFSASILALLLCSFSSYAQLQLTTVDAGPYAPGSSIAALFSINAESNLRPENRFTLYLSDASGNFASEVPIGEFNGFYSSFVNGKIPAATTAGMGYRLRIKSTSPALVSNESAPFAIRAGSPVEASLYNRNLLTVSDDQLIGFCSGRNNFNYNLENRSTSGADVTAFITNELTGAPSANILFDVSAKTFTAQLAHYTVLAKASLNGTVGTRAYMIVNNRANTAFGTAGTNDVCLGGDALQFNVIVNGTDGMISNYPGLTYRVDWGDDTNNIYTLKDIIANDNKVGHSYTRTACGNVINLGSTTVYNAFGISISAQNTACGMVGTPISTTAKVSVRPQNNFTVPATTCLNAPTVFTNTSVIGDNPGANQSGCVQNITTYTWYVDGNVVPGAIDKPKSFNLSYQFTTPGTYRVTVEATTNAACPPAAVTKTVCIQQPAIPSFKLNGSSSAISLCNTTILRPENTSFVDNAGCGTNTYLWTVTGGTVNATFVGGSTAASIEPQIKFNGIGEYKIKLTINAQKCGEISTTEQSVMVSGPPVATLSTDIVLCNLGTFNFSAASGPTRSILTGTPDAAIGADTYTWTVMGGAATFTGGTTVHSRYPRIQFTEFKVYTIKVVHKNGCNTVEDEQVIEFRSAPAVEAGNPAAICYEGTVMLNASNVPGYTPKWVGGAGTFSPNEYAANASYTPSQAEREAGGVNLRWQITTTLEAPCNIVEDIAAVVIRPRNLITTEAEKIICSNSSVAYLPLSSVTGSTFRWTSVSEPGITGATPSGTESINHILVNSSPTETRKVTYTITPWSNGCAGEAFDLVVKVVPRPVLTVSTAKTSICSGEGSAIAMTSNLPGVKYTWTASSNNSNLSGFSANNTATDISQINDVLINTGTSPGVVSYRITPIAGSGCPGTVRLIEITVNPLGTVAQAGSDETICSNAAYALEANIPEGTSTGRWALISGPPVVFADPNKYNTVVNGLQGGNVYTFRWTISTPAGCFTSDDVIITNLSELSRTDISASLVPVCKGQEVTITGEQPSGGSGFYTYSWESSIDEGSTWSLMPSEINKNLVVNINSTITYRRITKGGSCTLLSNPVKIIMLQPLGNNSIVSSNTTSADQSICAGTIGTAFKGSTPTGGDGIYLYQWQMSIDGGANWSDIAGATGMNYAPGLQPVTTSFRRIVRTNICTGYAESMSNVSTISLKPHAQAEFNAQSYQACAPFVIDAFNVKAVAYADRNSRYTWYADGVKIGEGINFPGYIIHSDHSSATIKLVVSSSLGCDPDESSQVFSTFENVRASFSQDLSSGCGPLLVNFTNTSNITAGVTFNWDFGNGHTSDELNPLPVNFLQDPSGKDKIYNVTLQAKNACGSSIVYRSTVTVRSMPVSVFSPGSTLGCAPLDLRFINTSPEAGNTTYTYDFGDGKPTETYSDRREVVHQFDAVSVLKYYTVRMTAKNECGEHTSEHTISISPNTIIAELVVDARDKQGCAPHTVQFANNSSEAISYTYDFGDGTALLVSNTAPEKINHTFMKAGTYTVTLTAKNNCTSVSTTETITVIAQPVTSFSVDKVHAYPGLKLKFRNLTTGGIKYLWEFGDGERSTSPEAEHAFSQLGTYQVKLSSTNVENCTSTFVMDIFIEGQPGSLFVPNAFIPGSETIEFREFKAKGTGIDSWRMMVFDKWGTLLWETTKLDDGKPVEGWDGTFKGQKMPEGVYFWKIDLKLRNGSEWKGVSLNSGAPKRTGTINLIR